MPRFILLCGPVGSGKRTFRENFASRNENSVIISSDEIVEQWALADQISFRQTLAEQGSNLPILMEDIAQAAFTEDRDVIWDQLNLTRQARRKVLEDVPDHYERIAVGFIAPTRFLLEANNKHITSTGPRASTRTVNRQQHDYEFPDFDEGFDQIIRITEPDHRVEVL